MLFRGLLAIVILYPIEFGENAIALIGTRCSGGAAFGIERGMDKQIAAALTPGCPHRAMSLGDGEVGAAGAGALGTQHRIGAAVVAKAGRTLTSIDAISPVAYAKPHIGLTQNEVDVFLRRHIL
jgi:hypothetical protein